MAEPSIDVEESEEIVEGFLGRMNTSAAEKLSERFWLFAVLISLFAGLLIGGLAFLIARTAGLLSGAASPAPQKVALVEPVAPAAPVPVALVTKSAPTPKPAPPASAAPTPKPDWHMLKVGWSHFNRGSFRSASAAFGQALKADPSHPGAFLGLTASLFALRQEQQALEVLERGVRLLSARSELWVHAGSLYQWLGNGRLARLVYARYLRDAPDGTFVRDVRAVLAQRKLPRLLPFEIPNREEMLPTPAEEDELVKIDVPEVVIEVP